MGIGKGVGDMGGKLVNHNSKKKPPKGKLRRSLGIVGKRGRKKPY